MEIIIKTMNTNEIVQEEHRVRRVTNKRNPEKEEYETMNRKRTMSRSSISQGGVVSGEIGRNEIKGKGG